MLSLPSEMEMGAATCSVRYIDTPPAAAPVIVLVTQLCGGKGQKGQQRRGITPTTSRTPSVTKNAIHIC